jgi:hypothetical protein
MDKILAEFEMACVELLPKDAARRILSAEGLYNNPRTLELFDMFEAGYEAAKASEWVSVEDELPSAGVDVLISSNYGITTGEYSIFSESLQDRESGNNVGMANMSGLVFTPTHWMPLPKGPSDE